MKKISREEVTKRYKIIYEIGAGGFGHVEKAYDNMKKELVALKIISNIIESKNKEREILLACIDTITSKLMMTYGCLLNIVHMEIYQSIKQLLMNSLYCA